MKPKKLTDALKPDENPIHISARVPESLHRRVKELLKKDGKSVNDLVLAAFKIYFEEKTHATAEGRSKE
jgi:predicted HicB family RNase H-like nuclease